jgi:hypothetical protein
LTGNHQLSEPGLPSHLRSTYTQQVINAKQLSQLISSEVVFVRINKVQFGAAGKLHRGFVFVNGLKEASGHGAVRERKPPRVGNAFAGMPAFHRLGGERNCLICLLRVGSSTPVMSWQVKQTTAPTMSLAAADEVCIGVPSSELCPQI